MPPIDRQRLKAMVLEYLRNHAREPNYVHLHNEKGPFFVYWMRRGEPLEVAPNQTALNEIYHELYLERIVVSGDGDSGGPDGMGWPKFRVTEFGQRVLSEQVWQPFDPDGFIVHFRCLVPQAHADVIRYLEESLNCFRARYLLASAVMLGCASEKAMLELVDAYHDAIVDPATKAKFASEVDRKMISRKYEALWKRLGPMKLPAELSEDLQSMLDGAFHLIRTTRNDAGHPAGKTIDVDAMHGNLLLFKSYCRRVYGLVEHFTQNKV